MQVVSKILPVLATIAIMAASTFSQTVSGTVYDEERVPLPGALVEAFPIRSTGFVGNVHWIRTDQNGHFQLALSSGLYEIRGKDEPSGYPDPNSLLALDAAAFFPRINVGREDIQGVQVRLGRKGGVLEGDLRDTATGKPIAKGKVVIRAAATPQVFVEIFANESGHFEYTIPPKPVVVSASADAYRSSGETEVTLSSGERRTIVLELEPARSD